MNKPNLRKRHRIRNKEIRELNQQLEESLGVSIDTDNIESGELDHKTVFIVDHKIIAVNINGKPYLTLKGILQNPPGKAHVVVDDGAVKFLYNGADVMSPGIVDADLKINKGDIVWVKEENHGRPLVIGSALISGEEMIGANKGKAVKTIYHLNDELWNAKL